MTLWLAYAATAQELNAQEACEALGYTAIVPRRVDLVRHMKRRKPDVVIRPYLPNYVFVYGSNHVFHAIKDVKELRGPAMSVGQNEKRLVEAFIAKVEDDFASRMAQIEAGERVSEYRPGDLLTLMTGQFAGHFARFKRMVESALDPFPKIEAELDIELLGKPVTAIVDPIWARKVG